MVSIQGVMGLLLEEKNEPEYQGLDILGFFIA